MTQPTTTQPLFLDGMKSSEEVFRVTQIIFREACRRGIPVINIALSEVQPHEIIGLPCPLAPTKNDERK